MNNMLFDLIGYKKRYGFDFISFDMNEASITVTITRDDEIVSQEMDMQTIVNSHGSYFEGILSQLSMKLK